MEGGGILILYRGDGGCGGGGSGDGEGGVRVVYYEG